MESNHDIGIAECNILQVEDDDAQLDNGQEYKRDVYETLAAMDLHIQDKIFKQTPPNKLYRRTVISGIRFSPSYWFILPAICMHIVSSQNQLCTQFR